MKLVNRTEIKPSLFTWSAADVVIALGIVLFGLYWLLSNANPGVEAQSAVIRRGDKVLESVSLKTDQRIDLSDHQIAMMVEISQGRIRVHSSDCNQQICVRKGWVNQVHDPIICIPKKVAITVTGSDNRYDAISR